MVKTGRIHLLLRSAKYIPIIAVLVALVLALARATTVHATGPINPKEVSPF